MDARYTGEHASQLFNRFESLELVRTATDSQRDRLSRKIVQRFLEWNGEDGDAMEAFFKDLQEF